jgi:hypothetical protein
VEGFLILIKTQDGIFALMVSESLRKEIKLLIEKHGGKLNPDNLNDIIKF